MKRHIRLQVSLDQNDDGNTDMPDPIGGPSWLPQRTQAGSGYPHHPLPAQRTGAPLDTLLPSISSSRAGDSDSVYTGASNQALRSLARQMGQIRNQSNPGP